MMVSTLRQEIRHLVQHLVWANNGITSKESIHIPVVATKNARLDTLVSTERAGRWE